MRSNAAASSGRDRSTPLTSAPSAPPILWTPIMLRLSRCAALTSPLHHADPFLGEGRLRRETVKGFPLFVSGGARADASAATRGKGGYGGKPWKVSLCS